MTDIFTASNGVQIRKDPNTGLLERKSSPAGDWVRIGATANGFAADSFVGVALRQYYRAANDERLDRWRSKDNPDFIVYTEGTLITIVYEGNGERAIYYRDTLPVGIGSPASTPFRNVLQEFLASEAKPWDDAQSGDAWKITLTNGSSGVYLVYGGEFRSALGNVLIKSYIKDATLVYREGD